MTRLSMNKNYVFWIGVLPTDDRVSARFKYGNFEWMQYSKNTWQYWCRKNGVEFVHYDMCAQPDLMRYKVNWQRWFDVFDYIEPDYDSIMLVDASIMVRWDAPNYFDIAPDSMCGMRANENWNWTYASATGYADLFPGVEFVHKDYFCSGMIVWRKQHESIIRQMKTFFDANHETLLEREDRTVLRGRDQPILNWLVQSNHAKFHHWTIDMAVNHLYRREILGNNWQLKIDPTPFFIKYFYAWQFSGFPDRGDTRTQLMRQTWDIIKSNYE